MRLHILTNVYSLGSKGVFLLASLGQPHVIWVPIFINQNREYSLKPFQINIDTRFFQIIHYHLLWP